MKINFERWVAGAFIGCLVLGVLLLPADGGRTFERWFATPERNRVEKWQTRMYARQNHEDRLIAAYDAAVDFALANREFGASAGKVGDPEIRFSAEVPSAMRVQFTSALNDERTLRPEWKGRGKVGVLVQIESPTRVNGQALKRRDGRSNRTLSRVIAPSAGTGDRCVVIIQLPSGDPWSAMYEKKPIGPVHPLLDACGFYDAFGAPGAKIGRDLADSRFAFARGYGWITAPRDSAKHPPRYVFEKWPYETREIRCLAGSDTACVAELRRREGDRWGYAASLMPDGVSSYRTLWRDLPFPSELNRLVLALGPQRFSRLWQSPETLEQAYLDETGRTLGQLVRDQDAHEDGAYVPGPWTSWLSLALSTLAIVAGLGLSMRFSARPRVA